MNVLGCLWKANDEPGLYPMTTSASIWHNKFNMNVNEAQIKIQHWMEKIKGGGVIPVGRKRIWRCCFLSGVKQAGLQEHLMLRGCFSTPLFCIALERENMVQQLKHIFQTVCTDDIAVLFISSEKDSCQASNFYKSALFPLGKSLFSFFPANGIHLSSYNIFFGRMTHSLHSS